MAISERAFQGVQDWPAITQLLDALPSASRHIIDLPYRLCSPPMQTGADARFWMADDGMIMGFAAWAYYWAVLDFFVVPSSNQDEVEQAIFRWALSRFRALDQTRGWPLPYWAEVREDDQARELMLAAHGFTLKDDYEYVQFHHPLGQAIPAVNAPGRITIRQMAGTREVATCVAVHRAAFASTSMTEEWRARTLAAPHYLPELDMVAEAADGTLVGSCLGWFHASQRKGQVEPIGILPAYQGQGIGRALLCEMLRRFAALGAQQGLVETDTTRPAALRIYESVGFEPKFRVLRKGLWIMPHLGE